MSEKHLAIPAHMIPTHVVAEAFKNKTQSNYLIHTYGGLGDLVCSEPAIRFALKKFVKAKISVITKTPDLYRHLELENLFDANKDLVDVNKYIVFSAYRSPNELFWEYLTHMACHPVDFSSISMWRMQMPIEDKEIRLPDYSPSDKELCNLIASSPRKCVLVHAGRHWPSKTFPKLWYDTLLTEFLREGFKVVLIGKDQGETGYVNVDPRGCIDLRDRLDVKDLICALKWAKFVFSNDSSPIHIAAAGNAFIGFVATIKHPDFLTHWRQGQFGYKTKNFGLDGAWNHVDMSPVQLFDQKVDVLSQGLMDSILPCPVDVVKYYASLQ
jgi:hypothetical protein